MKSLADGRLEFIFSMRYSLQEHFDCVYIFFQRAPSELSAHQKKIIPIDDHVGVSIAGLTADARLLR